MRDIRLCTNAKAIYDSAESVEDYIRVLSRLLLEAEKNAIHEFLFELCVYVSYSLVRYNLLDCLHQDLPVLFVLVFQLRFEDLDDLGATYFQRYLCRGVDELLVILLVEGIAAHPEVGKELRDDLLADVENLDAFGCYSLLYYFKDDLLHLIVIGSELTN